MRCVGGSGFALPFHSLLSFPMFEERLKPTCELQSTISSHRSSVSFKNNNYSGVAPDCLWCRGCARMKPQKMRGKISSFIPASSQFTVCLRVVVFFLRARPPPPQRSFSPLGFVPPHFPQLLILCRAARTSAAGSPNESPLLRRSGSVYFYSLLFLFFLTQAQLSCSLLKFFSPVCLHLYVSRCCR